MSKLLYDDNDRFTIYSLMADKFRDLPYYRHRHYTARDFMNERIHGCPLLLLTAALDIKSTDVETYRETGTRKIVIQVQI